MKQSGISEMKGTENQLAWGEVILLLIAGIAAWCLIFLSGLF